jgi:hypothetical protein
MGPAPCGAGLIVPKAGENWSVLAVVLAIAAPALAWCVAGCASRTAKPKAAKALIATAPIE